MPWVELEEEPKGRWVPLEEDEEPTAFSSREKGDEVGPPNPLSAEAMSGLLRGASEIGKFLSILGAGEPIPSPGSGMAVSFGKAMAGQEPEVPVSGPKAAAPLIKGVRKKAEEIAPYERSSFIGKVTNKMAEVPGALVTYLPFAPFGVKGFAAHGFLSGLIEEEIEPSTEPIKSVALSTAVDTAFGGLFKLVKPLGPWKGAGVLGGAGTGVGLMFGEPFEDAFASGVVLGLLHRIFTGRGKDAAAELEKMGMARDQALGAVRDVLARVRDMKLEDAAKESAEALKAYKGAVEKAKLGNAEQTAAEKNAAWAKEFEAKAQTMVRPSEPQPEPLMSTSRPAATPAAREGLRQQLAEQEQVGELVRLGYQRRLEASAETLRGQWSPEQITAATQELAGMMKRGVIGSKKAAELVEIVRSPEAENYLKVKVADTLRAHRAWHEAKKEHTALKKSGAKGQGLKDAKKKYDDALAEWKKLKEEVVQATPQELELRYGGGPPSEQLAIFRTKIQESLDRLGLKLPEAAINTLAKKFVGDPVEATRLLADPARLYELGKNPPPKQKVMKSGSVADPSYRKNLTQIHRLAKKAFGEGAEGEQKYRALLRAQIGRDTAKGIAPEEASRVISELRKLTGESKSPKGRKPTDIQPEQIRDIESVVKRLKSRDLLTDDELLKVVSSAMGEEKGLALVIDAKGMPTAKQAASILRRLKHHEEITKISKLGKHEVNNDPELRSLAEQNRQSRWSFMKPRALESSRFFFSKLEAKYKQPFYRLHYFLTSATNEIAKTHVEKFRRLEGAIAEVLKDSKEANREWHRIQKDSEAQGRIADYIASELTWMEGKPDKPINITPVERAVAEQAKIIFKEYEPLVRLRKLYELYYHPDRYPEIPEASRPGVQAQIDRAFKVWHSEGTEALMALLKTQDWGIIGSGFEPHLTLLNRLNLAKFGDTDIGKRWIRSRGLKFHKQEIDFLPRMASYMRQMDMGAKLEPAVEALREIYQSQDIRLTENEKFHVETVLRSFLGRNVIEGWLESKVTTLYNQAMTALIEANPVPAFRQIFEPFALGADKVMLANVAKRPMTERAVNFFHTQVVQMEAISDWISSGSRKGLKIFEPLNALAHRVAMFQYGDYFTRFMTFKTNWVKGMDGLELLKAGKLTKSEMLKFMHWEELDPIQRDLALHLWGAKGPEAVVEYIAAERTANTHALYDLASRSPAEQTTLGRTALRLFTFTRAYGERLAKQVGKLHKGNKSEKARAAKTIANVVIVGGAIGWAMNRLTGQRYNALNPMNVLDYSMDFSVGGLDKMLDTLSAAFRMVWSESPEMRKQAAMQFSTELPRLADVYVPFYLVGFRGLEAVAEKKNLDKMAIRWLISQVRDDYEMRASAYDVDRSILDAFRHIFFGSGQDLRRAEEEARARKKQKPRML